MKNFNTPEFSKTSKTYKTHAAAMKVASSLLDGAAFGDSRITVVIAATEDGRFAPVFVLPSALLHYALGFASRGFHVVG
jgi:hypothetical protein